MHRFQGSGRGYIAFGRPLLNTLQEGLLWKSRLPESSRTDLPGESPSLPHARRPGATNGAAVIKNPSLDLWAWNEEAASRCWQSWWADTGTLLQNMSRLLELISCQEEFTAQSRWWWWTPINCPSSIHSLNFQKNLIFIWGATLYHLPMAVKHPTPKHHDFKQ